VQDFLSLAGPFAKAIIIALVLVSFVAASAVFFIWLERKVAGRIQDRLGPTRVGGKFGWLQTIADGVKLLFKEDIIPADADQFLFRLGPYIAFCGSFLAFLALPFGDGVVGFRMNVAVFYMLAVMSTEVFGIILAGYGSGSKWSLFGGMREAAQMVSYEVPMALCVLVPVIVVGTMDLTVIGKEQEGFLWNWLVFHDPFTFAAFWPYFTCATASCKRAPFDLAEAESELVAGFHTEYSGLRWSFFFMAEYGSMFAVSGIAVLLFLGGWSLGIPWRFLHGGLVEGFTSLTGNATVGFIVGNIINVIVLIAKAWILVFVMMWVRWTLPRLRIDQVMMTCLKYLLPISCVLLLGVSLWQLIVYPVALTGSLTLGALARDIICIGSLLLFFLGFLRAALSTRQPFAVPTGIWDNAGLPTKELVKQS
jgi:NADH-quinone oxidoreductase subunit H